MRSTRSRRPRKVVPGEDRETSLRRRVVETCREMNAAGINQGTSGNLSARLDDTTFLVTPSGLDYEAMAPEDVVAMEFDGRTKGEGGLEPSSEWRMHRDILVARSDLDAVLHAHPVHATALACHGRGIPAFHYMVAAAGGTDIRCAPYHTFGSTALAEAALEAMEGRRACLLAHHGMLAGGGDPEAALALAVEVETLAAMYLEALRLGEPKALPEDEMTRVLEAFSHYGKARRR